MLQAWILVLLANLVVVMPATLVPRISTENGFQLEPGNGEYTLRIPDPNGDGYREEIVKEISPGMLEVKGTLNQIFKDDGGTMVVTYEAGPNGYVAKYSYRGGPKPKPPVLAIQLSQSVLKAAAG